MVGPPGGDGVFSGCGGARLLPSADTERPAKRFHPPARNPAPATLRVAAGPALDVRAGDDGGFSGLPSAPNQSGRRRGALAFDQGLRESPPLMTENPREDAASRRIRCAAVNHQPRRGRTLGRPRPGPRGRAALIISRLTSIP